MPVKQPSLKDVLSRLDAWIAASPARARLLAPPATDAAIAKAEKSLGTKLPATLRALYEWHDGETEGAGLLDALRADEHTEAWETYNTSEPELRWMSLAEVVAAGPFEAWFDDDTGACMRGEADAEEGVARTTLVPLLWMRGKDAPRDDEDDGVRAPVDDDWLFAIDTLHGGVFLFEIADEGLEGVMEEAMSFAAWLAPRVRKLEKGEIVVGAEAAKRAPATQAKTRPPAELLLHFLADRELVEIEEGSSIPEVAVRVTPLLALKPEKRAIASVIALLEEDAGIAEVFADDEVLKRIIAEFLD